MAEKISTEIMNSYSATVNSVTDNAIAQASSIMQGCRENKTFISREISREIANVSNLSSRYHEITWKGVQDIQRLGYQIIVN